MSIQKITQKSGVRYRARVRTERGQQITKTFRRKIDAEAWEREQLRLRARPDLRPDPVAEMTFGELAAEWQAATAPPRLAPSTWERYDCALRNQVYPWIREQLLADLDLAVWDDWFAELCEHEANWSTRTINHALTMVGTIHTWAKKRHGLRLNPCDQIEPLPQGEQGFDFWLADEVRSFLAAVEGEHLARFYTVAINTGMRRGELIGLQWDAVSFERSQITVRRSFCSHSNQLRETTKGKRQRVLPMSPTVRRALAAQRLSGAAPWVFTGPRGGMIQPCQIQRNFAAACAKAGVRKVRFHDLRHTYASHFMMAGGDLFTLQRLLGHRDITTTQRYAHLSPDHLQQAASVVEFGAVQEPAEILHIDTAEKK